MEPDDLLSSRNARTLKALVGCVQCDRRLVQPAVYKLDSELPDKTHDELTQGKTDESEEPSS
jgi:hypothetical protein